MHNLISIRDDTHMTFTLNVGVGRLRQKLSVIRRREVGRSKCSGRRIFILFNKENWICPMTKHHVEPNINILFTKKLTIDSGVRQWTKLNNRMCGQFECDVT